MPGETIVKTASPSSPGLPRSSWIALLLLLAGFAGFAAVADDDAPQPPVQPVDIQVHHGADLPWNRAGFRIDIAHWKPHADISIVAVGTRGERIDLTPDPVTADQDGTMSLDVDYDRTGLTPGHWTLVVGGPENPHPVAIDLPELERPPGAPPRFKMTYSAPGNR
jgi:hypothetical protein